MKSGPLNKRSAKINNTPLHGHDTHMPNDTAAVAGTAISKDSDQEIELLFEFKADSNSFRSSFIPFKVYVSCFAESFVGARLCLRHFRR